ncbi:DNA polymerase III subunit gamma/tau [bacterium]|jgi:DNA polymerase III subunit gamma/tau|nr:DNA polymerase III subunit gamma/tau [bacterium]
MSQIKLNLARKWRSQKFSHIVGQQLTLRMLKNSLFLDNYFPVYLFAGQRGCGKTTTARVFAASINCENLTQFQKEPKKHDVPCLSCISCSAMREGKHPDFIEIDAASHTGVDNIRTIIDSSTLLPLMGRKKIYLIDEAHMLSKSAFNAFLKILEEPPPSVLFILATTSEEKIIDTVRSRCFQLFFGPIKQDELTKHLEFVCKEEGINHEPEGLELIVEHSEGSARDALNLLEQVRLSQDIVDKKAVLAILGHIDDSRVLELIGTIVNKGKKDLLLLLDSGNFHSFSVESIWRKLVKYLRIGIWSLYGIENFQNASCAEKLVAIVKGCPVTRLVSFLEILYQHERIFRSTKMQHECLDMVLLSMCKNVNYQDENSSVNVEMPTNHDKAQQTKNEGEPKELKTGKESPEEAAVLKIDKAEDSKPDVSEVVVNKQQKEVSSKDIGRWNSFLQLIDEKNDPLLVSIFRQGNVSFVSSPEPVINIDFQKDQTFFNEWLKSMESLWRPCFDTIFGTSVAIVPFFTREPEKAEKKSKDLLENSRLSMSKNTNKIMTGPSEARIDISDKEKWEKTNILLEVFGGTIREIRQPE